MPLESLFRSLQARYTAQTLTLTASMEIGQMLKDFIGLLDGQQLAIRLTTFRYESESSPEKIIIQGATNSPLRVRGLNCGLTITGITVIYTETTGSHYSISMSVEATLPIASTTLEMQGSATDTTSMSFVLKTRPTRQFSLLDIAMLLSPAGENTIEPLPLSLLAGKVAPITSLEVTCDFAGSTAIAFSSQTGTDWTIMLNKAVFQNTRVVLNATSLTRRGGRLRYAFNGRLEGDLRIGERSYPILLHLVEDEIMEFQVLKSSGAFPTLLELVQWVDSEVLGIQTDISLRAMGFASMIIDKVNIGVNSEMEGRPFSYLCAETHMDLLGCRLNLITRLAPRIGLTIRGSLAQGATMSMAALVSSFCPQAPGFIDATITDLIIDSYPYRGVLTLIAHPAEEVLSIGPLTLGGASLELEDVAESEERTITLALEGTIMLAGLPLSAEIVGVASGWKWIAVAPQESMASLQDLHNDLARLFHVQFEAQADRLIKKLKMQMPLNLSKVLIQYVEVEGERAESIELERATTPRTATPLPALLHFEDEVSHEGSVLPHPSTPEQLPGLLPASPGHSPLSPYSSSQEIVMGTPSSQDPSFWDLSEEVPSSQEEPPPVGLLELPTFQSPFPSLGSSQTAFESGYSPYPMRSTSPYPTSGYVLDDEEDTQGKKRSLDQGNGTGPRKRQRKDQT
ncbi:hypothetical protein [Ktedonospora formicarum]|uniref:Uncharacterized protein n=1 Tax=Ktedonospora formicarum TaxID=2778364 RepID=A0A8J3MYG6_9CHLR|nr:hypothetical protein [Ktedonospora formicarum]GHO50788.1 hypothetical protein KSX_89510 [Ktedonospora formicarum]